MLQIDINEVIEKKSLMELKDARWMALNWRKMDS